MRLASPIDPYTAITGVGFYIRRVSNVIMRNLKIGRVDADNGDAIGIDRSTNVWVDHCDLSGDLSAGKNDLDGLLDITHGSEWITVSNTYFHDHVSRGASSRCLTKPGTDDVLSGKAP